MKCAYVTLVMLGNEYVKGAVALAKSLKKSGTQNDIVCMVTPDVTQLDDLSKVFTKLIPVSYLYYECGKMSTKRQQQLYTKWINFSFTKWRCFELIMYDRCVYLDADQVVVQNVDHLFIHEYAMCFNYNYNSLFKVFKNLQIVNYHVQKFVLENSDTLAFTGTLVYTPSINIFTTITNLLNTSNPLLNTPVNKFNNGFDEIVLAQVFVLLQINVVQLSYMYVWNAGDYRTLNTHTTQPYIINFYGDRKPWFVSKSVYIDEYIWWYFYMLNDDNDKML
ncbi:p13 [Clostera anastomosis granulovirus B]|uniref:p13 n=1 Tax=Clostera anastomosis granulovirus B TaxID=1986290 RepID=A0A0K0WSI5_9BBAC|nr:p13 [Clostera anastomosis granulovirus B]AKS25378.1 p13 [Clostera anastomosis granulovirus B]